jgi:hypothetical protein
VCKIWAEREGRGSNPASNRGGGGSSTLKVKIFQRVHPSSFYVDESKVKKINQGLYFKVLRVFLLLGCNKLERFVTVSLFYSSLIFVERHKCDHISKTFHSGMFHPC